MEPHRLIEPTPDEKKNGWDAESLAAYVKEREAAQAETVLNRPSPRPKWANNQYSPLRWR